MRKFFYGVSVFMFLCILSLGYYATYKMGDMNRKMSQQELLFQEEAQAARKAELENQAAEETLESAAAGTQEGGYGLFYLKEADGYVMVYERDKKTLYEPTSILVSMLPENLRRQIAEGKFLKSQEELYSFLENYSS